MLSAALDALALQLGFFFDLPAKGDRIWQIGFVRYIGGQKGNG